MTAGVPMKMHLTVDAFLKHVREHNFFSRTFITGDLCLGLLLVGGWLALLLEIFMLVWFRDDLTYESMCKERVAILWPDGKSRGSQVTPEDSLTSPPADSRNVS